MAHGFFVAMGGFCNSSGDILSCKDLYPLQHELNREACRESWITALAEVPEEEIEERSKADGFSKAIAIVQIFWFVLQCLARRIQHLPIVPIEMSALAFSILSIVLYMIWWYKPFDVQVHVVLPLGAKLDYAGHDDRGHVGFLRCINDCTIMYWSQYTDARTMTRSRLSRLVCRKSTWQIISIILRYLQRPPCCVGSQHGQ